MLIISASYGKNAVEQGTNQEPPTVARFSHNVSPEDQAVLEAEHEQNSKPDKATRMEIVKKVALGEKEVQVSPSQANIISRAES